MDPRTHPTWLKLTVPDEMYKTHLTSFQWEHAAMILGPKLLYSKWMMCWLRTCICFNFPLSTQRNKTRPFPLHEEKSRSSVLDGTKMNFNIQHSLKNYWRIIYKHITLAYPKNEGLKYVLINYCTIAQKFGVSKTV